MLSLGVAYEADLFGRVQNTIDGARASAEQSAADLENTRLVITTDLAAAYFNLRQIDTEIDVLNRRSACSGARSGSSRTAAIWAPRPGSTSHSSRRSSTTPSRRSTYCAASASQFENAVATLAGTPAPVFSLPPQPTRVNPPPIPVGVPSDILERRPDVAAAERAMAAANSQIGIAKAAFYPSIVLGPSIGVQSTRVSTLFDSPSMIWSLGVSVAPAAVQRGPAAGQPRFRQGRLRRDRRQLPAHHADGDAGSRRRH